MSGCAKGKLQLPLASAVVVPTWVPSTLATTVTRGAEVPESVGVVLVKSALLAGKAMVGVVNTQLSELHVAPVGQLAVAVQRTQTWLVVSQTGDAPLQSVLAKQPLMTV